MIIRSFILVCFILQALVSAGQSCSLDNFLLDYGDVQCEVLTKKFVGELEKYNSEDEQCVFEAIYEYRDVPNNRMDCYNNLYAITIDWFLSHDRINHSLLTKLYITQGGNYKFQANYITALENLNNANLHLSKATNPIEQDKLKIEYNLGEVYRQKNDSKRAIAFLDAALTTARYDSFNKSKRRIYLNLSYAFAQNGDRFMFNTYDALARFYLDNVDSSRKKTITYKLEKARWLDRLGKPQEALIEYQSLIKIRDEFGLSNKNDIALSTKLGLLYVDMGEMKLAKAELEYQINKLKLKDGDLANYYFNSVKHVKKNSKEAIELLNKVIAITVNHENIKNLLGAYKSKAKIYMHNDQLDSAEYYLKKMITTLDKDPASDQSLIKRMSSNVVHLQIKQKKFYKDGNENHLLEAYVLLNNCLNEINEKINGLTDDNSLMELLSSRRQIYDIGLVILADLHKLDPKQIDYIELAFKLIEDNKSLILLSNARKNRSFDLSSDIRIYSLLKDSIRENINKVNDVSIPIENRKLVSLTLCRQVRDLRALRTSTEVPKYVDSDKSISEYEGVPFIAYHQDIFSDSLYYRLSYNDKHATLDRIILNSKDNDAIESILSNSFKDNFDSSYFDTLSVKLLPNNISDNVLLLPDGQLSFLPFELLRYNGKLLIESTTVSYAFSINHLKAMEKISSSGNSKMVCYAPQYQSTDNGGNEQKLAYLGTRRSGTVLSDLKYNKSEVKKIAQYFPDAEINIGDRANKQKFIKDSESVSILHIAGHATASKASEDNYIYFDSDSTDSSYALSLEEIYKLNIPAELVTLSACETGIGKVLSGEGVLSLSRGFAYAGSKSIINSLWSVDDKSTSQIMTSMYDYLSKGDRKDIALRKAKLDYINNASPKEKHPFYWAGFVAIGDMSPIVGSKFSPSNFLILGVIAIMLLVLLFCKRS